MKLSRKISSYARMQENSLLEPILEKISTIASGATPIESAGRAPDKIPVSKSGKEGRRRLFSIGNLMKTLPLGGSLY
jgi:hypothetical protein